MIISNIWKNKSHVPVTTNQFKASKDDICTIFSWPSPDSEICGNPQAVGGDLFPGPAVFLGDPTWEIHITIVTMAIEIVDFSIENGDVL